MFKRNTRSRIVIASVIACLAATACTPTTLTVGSGGINAPEQRDKPYLILISIDGFRWDFQQSQDTPALDRIAASGVRARSMQPAFPTLTFPNHYSIATGLYPAEHGIVGNDFPNEKRDHWYHYKDRSTVQDGSWYGGEPIWVSAEKNGMVSAAFFFVGTEAPVAGIPLTYWYPFDASIPGEKRIEQALMWLELPEPKRPHVITLYFEDVDVATHDFGIGSAQSAAAIRKADAYIGRLLEGIDRLDIKDEVYVFVVSDHGQSGQAAAKDVFVLSDHIDLEGLSVIDGGTFVSLYLDSPDEARAKSLRDEINAKWSHGRAILREEAPEHWRVHDCARCADMTLLADPEHAVLSHRDMAHKINVGNHGLEPTFKDMHGIFLATGPRLPAGKTLPEISVVDIYPLMLEILELPPPDNIDVDKAVLGHLLRHPQH